MLFLPVMKNEVYLLLGSNLGNRQAYLKQAIEALARSVGQILRLSSLFETVPWGNETDEHLYLNQAVLLETTFAPSGLIRQALKIEHELGRKRGNDKYEARTIDIDVMFFNQLNLIIPELIVPHPRLHLRRFVLEPLCEIASGYVHPGLNKDITTLLDTCLDTLAVVKLPATESGEAFSFSYPFKKA